MMTLVTRHNSFPQSHLPAAASSDGNFDGTEDRLLPAAVEVNSMGRRMRCVTQIRATLASGRVTYAVPMRQNAKTDKWCGSQWKIIAAGTARVPIQRPSNCETSSAETCSNCN